MDKRNKAHKENDKKKEQHITNQAKSNNSQYETLQLKLELQLARRTETNREKTNKGQG